MSDERNIAGVIKMRVGKILVFLFVLSMCGGWCCSVRAAGEKESPGGGINAGKKGNVVEGVRGAKGVELAGGVKESIGFTAVVGHLGGAVVLRDGEGKVISQRGAGVDDAGVIQAGAELCREKGGELRILAGRYDLKKSIVLDFPCTVSGEGRGTVLIPPANEYAIRIVKTDRSPTINDWVWGPERPVIPQGWIDGIARLYGIYVSSLAIVGDGRGKGIYLNYVTECICEDLAIHTTGDGAAIYVDETVMESEFRSVVCYGCGSEKNKEAALVVASQDTGDCNNNLQFTRVHVLLPNYVGVQIGTDKKYPPRLIFFSDSFFHGWGKIPSWREEGKREVPYDLFVVHAGDGDRSIVITSSRFTNSGSEKAELRVEKGSVLVSDCVLGGGVGRSVIVAEPGSEVAIRGNKFEKVTDWKWALEARGANVIFAENFLGAGGRLNLKDMAGAVVMGNRFKEREKGAIVGGGRGWLGLFRKGRVMVEGNLFE